jgi:hypothetical protein
MPKGKIRARSVRDFTTKGHFYREGAKDTKIFKCQVWHLHSLPRDLDSVRGLRFFAVKGGVFQ